MPASPSVASKKSPPTQFHDKIDYFNHVANNNNNNHSPSALVPGGVVTTQNISTVIKPKGNDNSLQFVKIQTPELSKKAVEQIKLAEDSKISKNKIKEVEEEWQNNLLSWKSKRRQQFPTSAASENEPNSGSLDSNDGSSGRRFKTFAEMIEQRAKSGNRLSFHLQRYVGDDGYGAEAEGEEEKAGANEEATDQHLAINGAKKSVDEDEDDGNHDDKISDTSDLVSEEADERVFGNTSSTKEASESSFETNRCEIKPSINESPSKTFGHQCMQPEMDTVNTRSKSDVSSEDSSFEDMSRPTPLIQNNAKPPAAKSLAPPPPLPPPLPMSIKQQNIIPQDSFNPIRKTPDTRPSRTNSNVVDTPIEESKRLVKDNSLMRDAEDSDRSNLSSDRSPSKPIHSPMRNNNNVLDNNHRNHHLQQQQQQQFLHRQSTPNPPPQFSHPPAETPKSTPSQRKHIKDHMRDDNDKPYLSVSGKKRCSSCREELGRGAAAFVVESLSLVYHTNCFRCSVCHANLANGFKGVNVRVHAGALHCHNCYSKDGLNYSRV